MRYRALLSPYRLARGVGLSEDAWAEFAGRLDEALAEVDGRGFRLTPMTQERDLARAAGLGEGFWVKDETINVAGSHKARHLMGVMLYLRVPGGCAAPGKRRPVEAASGDRLVRQCGARSGGRCSRGGLADRCIHSSRCAGLRRAAPQRPRRGYRYLPQVRGANAAIRVCGRSATPCRTAPFHSACKVRTM